MCLRRPTNALIACILLLCLTAVASAKARHVIIMISDGQGFNVIAATRYYTGSPASYETADWAQCSVQTSSADNPGGYQPDSMWSDFQWQFKHPTDSAAAITAICSGRKTRNGMMNMMPDGTALRTFFESAAADGMSIGAITTVPLSHATPAGVYAHNKSRNNYAEIAKEGIYGSCPCDDNGFYDAGNYHGMLRVLMGTGHPDYDDNNQPSTQTDKYVGGQETWADLTDGSPPNGWTLIQDRSEFAALASGPAPAKLLGVAKASTTLQFARDNNHNTQKEMAPTDPLNANVPSLAQMTAAALNVLDDNPDGFAVLIEGGAVDEAGHANNLGREIEEQMDFNAGVQAVLDWVATHDPQWQNTLLIITADHETGGLWGPDEHSDANGDGQAVATTGTSGEFKRLQDRGAGNLPGHKYNSGGHTNQLVPLRARGSGSELFKGHVIGTDQKVAGAYGVDEGFDDYIDNTSIYQVMMDAADLTAAATEPATQPATHGD